MQLHDKASALEEYQALKKYDRELAEKLYKVIYPEGQNGK
jgi:hypothetical protein